MTVFSEEKKQLFEQLEKLYNEDDLRYYNLFISKEIDTPDFCGECEEICCKSSMNFPISLLEIDYISYKTDCRADVEAFKYFIRGEEFYGEYQTVCPFFNFDLPGCRIYNVRPSCCRRYGRYAGDNLMETCHFKSYKHKLKDIGNNKLENLKLSYYRIFEKALKLESGEDFSSMGRIHEYRKEPQKAINYYKKALKVNPNDSDYYNDMADCYFMLGEYENACETYKKAIEINEKEITYQTNLAEVYLKMGKREESFDICKKCLKIDPKNTLVYNQLGEIYFEMKKFKKALTFFKKAYKINPSFKLTNANLGDTYFEIGDLILARMHFLSALESDPDYRYASIKLDAVNEQLKMCKYL